MFVSLLLKLGAFLKTAIMATIADHHFHVFFEASESPNFFDVPSNLPFPEKSSRLLKNENKSTGRKVS
jgi:hypothetical protein